MQFLYDGEFYKVINISGPSHNYLGLAFSGCENEVTIQALAGKDGESFLISSESVLEQVVDGVRQANQELPANEYFVCRIQYIPSDTPSNHIYTELTKTIIRRLAVGGEFKRV